MQLPVEGEHERIKQASEDMKVVDRTCMAYTTRSISHAEWLAEAERLFGPNPLKWRFVCPSCGHVASVEDWKSAGASEGEVAFSCVGRHSTEEHKAAKAVFGRQGGPCNYAGRAVQAQPGGSGLWGQRRPKDDVRVRAGADGAGGRGDRDGRAGGGGE